MKRPLATWCLAGALAASLAFNYRQLAAAPVPDPAPAEDCAASCELGLGGLCLAPGQGAALDEVCETACIDSERLAREADEREQALLQRIASAHVDATEARRLADEVSDLRRRSLAACVEGILRVREVLTPEQCAELVAASRAEGAP